MKIKSLAYSLLVLLLGSLLFLPGDVFAQDEEYVEETVIEETVVETPYKPFDKAQWEKITKKADFTDEKAKEEEVVNKPKERDTGSMFSGNAIKYILYGLFGLILIFVIYSIAFDRYGVSNTAINVKEEVDIETIAENLPESQLEQYLKKALTSQSYRTAIRLYYLMVIQGLSNKQFIRWKKDKTNRDYLNEMRQHDYFGDFRKLTRIFEYIWYGEVEISEKDYQSLKPDFEQFLQSVNRQKMAS